MSRGTLSVEHALIAHLKKGGRYLLAVSGGKDSMCLLRGCLALRQQLDLTLEVAHVNYHLRDESTADMNFVADEASAANLALHVHECSPPEKGVNFEKWAREVRYGFFKECLNSRSLDRTLTAHTAHDQAETLLMRLISNKEPASILLDDVKRGLLRPFLHVSLSEIQRYLCENEVPHITDSTNEDTAFLRNRVRHLLLPLLEKEFEPKISELLAERAGSLQEDIQTLYSIAVERGVNLSSHTWGSIPWSRSLKEMTTQPDESALHWRLMSSLLSQKLGYRPGRNHCLRALEVIHGKSLGCELPGGWNLRRNKGGEVSLLCERS